MTKSSWYSLLPQDSASASPTSPLPPPISASHNTAKHGPISVFWSVSRLSYRRVTAVVCGFFFLYGLSTVRITYTREVATAIVERRNDTCADEYPSGIQPGGLFKFTGDDDIVLDNYYIAIDASLQHSRPKNVTTEPAPLACLDAHIAFGTPCVHPSGPEQKRGQQLDVVWSYVNSSDFIHVESYQDNLEYTRDHKTYTPPTKKNAMREFDELRFSVRSVAKNFRRTARKLFIVTSDFPFPGCEQKTDSHWRVGQMPRWLAYTKQNDSLTWRDGDLSLDLVHHSDVFDSDRRLNESIFNSLAIESRLAFVDGLADNFVYMNDDVFFNNELSARDFYTTEYGPVFRTQPDVMIGSSGRPRGEWVALQHTNKMLNARFGERSRPYLTHIAKALSVPFLRELHAIWGQDMNRTASHPFRSYLASDADASTTLLQTHYVVERWREALLWSYIVGRVGGEDDTWGKEQTAQAWRDFGGREGEETILVKRGPRKTLEDMEEKMVNDATMPPGKTSYAFSSMDGYPYTSLGSSGQRTFPSFSNAPLTSKTAEKVRDLHPGRKCTLNLHRCLQVPGGTASEIFKHVAFRSVDCGDCIISALMTKTGPLGLEAFLPDAGRAFPSKPFSLWGGGENLDPTPRLPLTAVWETTDFKLRSIAASVPDGSDGDKPSVREWVVRALHRYRFVLGNTPVTFAQLENKASAQRVFARLDKIQGTASRPAIICLNDDVGQGADDVRKLFTTWMARRWPTVPQWEA